MSMFQRQHRQEEAWCRPYLWRLIDGGHSGTNSQRHVFMLFILSVQETDALQTGTTVMVQETFNQIGILETDIVNMTISL